MLNKFSKNLTLKYLTITSIFVLVIQILFGMGSIYWKSRSQLKELQTKAIDEAKFLSAVTPESLLDLDFSSLERLVKQTTIDQNIIYAVVVNPQKEAITSFLATDKAIIAQVLANKQSKNITHQNILPIIEQLANNSQIQEIRQPISSSDANLGEIYLGYSTALIEQKTRRDLMVMLGISVIVSGLLASLNFLLFRRFVLIPINSLNKFAIELSEGNLDQRITQFDADEFGSVIKAFNQMAEQLQETLKGLTEARDEALAATKAKSNFLAAMSHEIRTPMNAVMGMSSLLMETQLSEEQWKFADTIRHSSENLLQIINEILDFSKIEANRLELEIYPFDLHRCIHEAISVMGIEASNKKLTIEYKIDENTPQHIQGDATRIRQILLNLLSNAIKFTDFGSVTLTCCLNENNPHPTIAIAIQDTGIGISPEQQTKLFQPFSQADNSVTRRYGGTGLGLVICKRICELMEGHISLVSELGLGSKFTVTIPYLSVDAEELLNIPELDIDLDFEIDQQETLQPRDEPLRILLAEDIPSNCQVASLMFARLGYGLDIVGNGKEVLEALDRQEYDIVFMDWNMPEMDGITATQKIRERYGNPEKPWIVAMTAHAMKDHQQTCFEAGMNDFIAKPIDCNSIAQAIFKCPTFNNFSNHTSPLFPSPSSRHHKNNKTYQLTISSNIDEVIDQRKWEEIVSMAGKDNLEMINEVVENFLKTSQQHMQTIENAIDQKSIEKLDFAAHSLKGSSQCLGAFSLSDTCYKLEKIAQQLDWEGAKNLLPDLQTSHTLAANILREKYQSLFNNKP